MSLDLSKGVRGDVFLWSNETGAWPSRPVMTVDIQGESIKGIDMNGKQITIDTSEFHTQLAELSERLQPHPKGRYVLYLEPMKDYIKGTLYDSSGGFVWVNAFSSFQAANEHFENNNRKPHIVIECGFRAIEAKAAAGKYGWTIDRRFKIENYTEQTQPNNTQPKITMKDPNNNKVVQELARELVAARAATGLVLNERDRLLDERDAIKSQLKVVSSECDVLSSQIATAKGCEAGAIAGLQVARKSSDEDIHIQIGAALVRVAVVPASGPFNEGVEVTVTEPVKISKKG